MTNGFISEDPSMVLANYLNSLDLDYSFERKSYSHMGATIADSVLQAGLNYHNVVYPRIALLLNNYSQYTTTTDFILLINLFTLEELISFKNKRKTQSIIEISILLQSRGVENEEQLAVWMLSDENIASLLDIKGVGPKTVDYLKTLVELDAIAIDRHLFSFLTMAGVKASSYSEASRIYANVANHLDIAPYVLDRAIWFYMVDYCKTIL